MSVATTKHQQTLRYDDRNQRSIDIREKPASFTLLGNGSFGYVFQCGDNAIKLKYEEPNKETSTFFQIISDQNLYKYFLLHKDLRIVNKGRSEHMTLPPLSAYSYGIFKSCNSGMNLKEYFESCPVLKDGSQRCDVSADLFWDICDCLLTVNYHMIRGGIAICDLKLANMMICPSIEPGGRPQIKIIDLDNIQNIGDKMCEIITPDYFDQEADISTNNYSSMCLILFQVWLRLKSIGRIDASINWFLGNVMMFMDDHLSAYSLYEAFNQHTMSRITNATFFLVDIEYDLLSLRSEKRCRSCLEGFERTRQLTVKSLHIFKNYMKKQSTHRTRGVNWIDLRDYFINSTQHKTSSLDNTTARYTREQTVAREHTPDKKTSVGETTPSKNINHEMEVDRLSAADRPTLDLTFATYTTAARYNSDRHRTKSMTASSKTTAAKKHTTAASNKTTAATKHTTAARNKTKTASQYTTAARNKTALDRRSPNVRDNIARGNREKTAHDKTTKTHATPRRNSPLKPATKGKRAPWR